MKTKHLLRYILVGLAAAVVGIAAPVQAGSGLEPSSNTPIKLPIMQSSDFDFIVTVYGEVLKEAGYRVEYINADYSASFSRCKGWRSRCDLWLGHDCRSESRMSLTAAKELTPAPLV